MFNRPRLQPLKGALSPTTTAATSPTTTAATATTATTASSPPATPSAPSLSTGKNDKYDHQGRNKKKPAKKSPTYILVHNFRQPTPGDMRVNATLSLSRISMFAFFAYRRLGFGDEMYPSDAASGNSRKPDNHPPGK